MIKVLHIGMSYKLGGIEQFYINYLENIDRTKCEVDFINVFESAREQDYYKKILENGSKIYDIYDYRKHPIKFYKSFMEIINKNSYDIIHYSMNSAVYLLPLIAAKNSKAKVVIAHSHNASSDKGLIKNFIHSINKNFIPLFANVYFACSNKAGSWFFSKKIMNSKKYFVINNAINIEKFFFNQQDRNDIRKELNISDDTIVLGHVGRFKKQKNHKFLIDLIKKISIENSKYLLLLVGDGPLLSDIKKTVTEYNVEKNVLFLGQRNDVSKIFQAMDIFLLPSLYEGLPLVGVEAQSSGLKCIFSNEITQEISLLKNTRFLDINSVDDWIKEINEFNEYDRLTVLKDSSLYDYDLKFAADKLLSIYRKTLGE